jgi:hypothetical protein
MAIAIKENGKYIVTNAKSRESLWEVTTDKHHTGIVNTSNIAVSRNLIGKRVRIYLEVVGQEQESDFDKISDLQEYMDKVDAGETVIFDEGTPVRKVKKEIEVRKCLECGKVLQGKQRKYCSINCGVRNYNKRKYKEDKKFRRKNLEYKREYSQRPEVKKRLKEYRKKYYQRPYVKQKAREASRRQYFKRKERFKELPEERQLELMRKKSREFLFDKKKKKKQRARGRESLVNLSRVKEILNFGE